MTVSGGLLLVVSGLVFVYLAYALLKAERF
ncbi:MAG: potassium-transporting ATPase subunit F [Acidimicrobiales bacterium]